MTFLSLRRCFAVAMMALSLASFSTLRAEDKPAEVKGDPNGSVAQQLQHIEDLKAKEAKSQEEAIQQVKTIQATADKVLAKVKDKKSDDYQKAFIASRMARAQLAPIAEPAEQRKTLDLFKADLTGKNLVLENLKLAFTLAQGLEQSGNSKLAAEAYTSFAALISKSKVEGLGEKELKGAVEFFASSGRRLSMVGSVMKLTGTTLDGKKFDVASLKGKVVLVDFWATWCGPCVAEHPNIERNYHLYHKRGFEVVGVSLDRDRGALEQYVKAKKVPWITLHEKEAGGQHPAAAYYGISGIPAMFLIGKDGKVVSLAARGQELSRLLAEMLGPAEEAGGK